MWHFFETKSFFKDEHLQGKNESENEDFGNNFQIEHTTLDSISTRGSISTNLTSIEMEHTPIQTSTETESTPGQAIDLNILDKANKRNSSSTPLHDPRNINVGENKWKWN